MPINVPFLVIETFLSLAGVFTSWHADVTNSRWTTARLIWHVLNEYDEARHYRISRMLARSQWYNREDYACDAEYNGRSLTV